jgi:lycopene cyclase-like protein
MSSGAAADLLVIGSGPAALIIAASLADLGLSVQGLAGEDPHTPWRNTYGIWGEEVDSLGLSQLLANRWSNTVSYFGTGLGGDEGCLAHGLDYGLFQASAIQQHLLERCGRGGITWRQGMATGISHGELISTVQSSAACSHQARLVIDASGHQPVFLKRPFDGPVAGQAAYGVVGRFSVPPVQPGQFVLMDYRCDHLTPEERLQPPTFLYAMHLGDDRYFVEETSLALTPPLSFGLLQGRLERRLAKRGALLIEQEHVEHCLFPMNPALPTAGQRLLGFGGAASMVHPASGYMLGGLLRRAPGLAKALAQALNGAASPEAVAAAGWGALWPPELQRRHAIYRFGLEKLMRFNEQQLRAFFATFFSLPNDRWFGFLANTLSFAELLPLMLQLFAAAPWQVRWGLMQPRGRELALLAKLVG